MEKKEITSTFSPEELNIEDKVKETVFCEQRNSKHAFAIASVLDALPKPLAVVTPKAGKCFAT